MRPARACSSAFARISWGSPLALMSIWSAVIPWWVPATLKSMSPQASSLPAMSERMAVRLPSVTRPMATPATGPRIFTPASIRASVPPHTVAMEEDPLDSRMSATTRIV